MEKQEMMDNLKILFVIIWMAAIIGFGYLMYELFSFIGVF